MNKLVPIVNTDEEYIGCESCVFLVFRQEHGDSICRHIRCLASQRSDGEDVYFELIEPNSTKS